MPSIIIPSRWRQQPTGLLEINWANPLARAIRLAAPLRNTKQVFSRDGIQLAATGVSLGTCSRGIGAVFPGTSGNRIDLGTTPILTTGVPYTFSLLLRPATPSAFSSPLGLRFGTSAVLFIRGTNESYMATIGPLNATVRNFNAAGAPTSGVEEHWIASNAVGPESNAVDAYFNGVSRTYLNSAYGGGTATNSYIGWDGFDDHWSGLIQNVVVWSRALSAPEAAEFYANPWQIYRKRSRVLYFETAGGGTSQVTSDLADSYAIRAAVSQDCADSYAIRSAITQDLADSYTLRAIANGDLADSYAIRGAVAQDLADAYDIQTSGVVTSDLADSYAIRAAVAQDVSDSYAIRAAVQASLADAYSVRAAVQASLADAYTIITTTSADLDDVYVIRAQVAADMVDSYAVFASTGGGSCPSAAEIAAAVRTELAAELANMDASVSGVPAAVWAHNLP